MSAVRGDQSVGHNRDRGANNDSGQPMRDGDTVHPSVVAWLNENTGIPSPLYRQAAELPALDDDSMFEEIVKPRIAEI